MGFTGAGRLRQHSPPTAHVLRSCANAPPAKLLKSFCVHLIFFLFLRSSMPMLLCLPFARFPFESSASKEKVLGHALSLNLLDCPPRACVLI
eukprot:2058999-Amphidinium_carterae.1